MTTFFMPMIPPTSTHQQMGHTVDKHGVHHFYKRNNGEAEAKLAAHLMKHIPEQPYHGTLREFPKFEPKNLWFRYPVHVEDTTGVLKDLQSESEMHPYQRGNQKRGKKTKETYAAQKADKKAALLNAFHACNLDGAVTVDDMAEYLGISEKTVRRRVKDCEELIIENNSIQLSKMEKNGGTK